MSNGVLTDKSYGELIDLLARENELYLANCRSLIKNGKRRVDEECMPDFVQLTADYLRKTAPIRERLYSNNAH